MQGSVRHALPSLSPPLWPLSAILPEDSNSMVVTFGIVTPRGQSGHGAEDRGCVGSLNLSSYSVFKPNSPTQVLGRFLKSLPSLA